MATATSIEWTDVTWNPIRGCSRVSEGCRNCYAEKIATRFSGEGQPFFGYAEWRTKSGHLIVKGDERLWAPAEREGRWTGNVSLVVDKVDEPLRWTRRHRVFVNSMSDFFHEGIKDDTRDELFAVMALCGLEGRNNCLSHCMARGVEHGSDGGECALRPMAVQTFQILTKRPEVLHRYMTGGDVWGRVQECADGLGWFEEAGEWLHQDGEWPLPNVWLGVSVEDQETADRRIPILLASPAAKRFVSYEPALGPLRLQGRTETMSYNYLDPARPCTCAAFVGVHAHESRGLSWVIVGGESGPGARPFDLGWARTVVGECRAAEVPVFVKQLGARPYEDMATHGHLRPWAPYYAGCDACEHSEQHHHTGKNADMAQWPEDLQVREFPPREPSTGDSA